MSKGFLGHPRGLSTLFFTEMWERFSYYGMRAILVLFMTTETAQEGLGLDAEDAGAIYGLYTAGVYLLTLPGGWLADNIFGQRKAIWYGGILIMIGHLLLAIPGMQWVFFLGLAFVASGTGMLKPNISTIVGDLYSGDTGARRDAGFSIFYMGINLGSLLGQTIVGYLGEKIDWHLGFGSAAVGMLLGLIVYKIMENRTLGDIGMLPKKKLPEEVNGQSANSPNRNFALILTGALIIFLVSLQFFGAIDVTTPRGLAEAVGIMIVTITLFYFAYILIGGGLTESERKRVYVIFFLFIGAALFWAGFEQAGSTLNLFARDYTDRMIGDWELPASWLQNFNPLFIVLLAPVVGALWINLSARNLNPNTPVKFGIGLILMAIGFIVMFFAAHVAIKDMQAGMQWLIITYLFHSLGELTLSPVGLSATTKLAPRRYLGQMMGIWFVGTSLGNLIAGLLAGSFDSNNAQDIPNLFWSVAMFGAGSGILFLIFSPVLKKWMGDDIH